MFTDVSAVLPSLGWHVESGDRYLPSYVNNTNRERVPRCMRARSWEWEIALYPERSDYFKLKNESHLLALSEIPLFQSPFHYRNAHVLRWMTGAIEMLRHRQTPLIVQHIQAMFSESVSHLRPFSPMLTALGHFRKEIQEMMFSEMHEFLILK